MFSLLGGVYDSYLAPTQMNLLVVGASGVGKTTLLERLKVTQMPKKARSQPTPTQRDMTEDLHLAFMEGGAREDSSAPTTPASTKVLKKTQVVRLPDPGLNPGLKLPTPAGAPVAPVLVTKAKRVSASGKIKALICPAPERYRNSAADQEEDFILEDHVNHESLGRHRGEEDSTTAASSSAPDEQDVPLEAPLTPRAPLRVRAHSKEYPVEDLGLVAQTPPPPRRTRDSNQRISSMESVPLDDGSCGTGNASVGPLLQTKFHEYNLKPKAKMLPMSRIRPTIGTNLGKMEMCGAKCHFFDVGGRMETVWDRYYADCDAVIFCWKLGTDPEAPPKSDNDSDDEEEPLDFSRQQQLLNQVRRSIPDDVPFLVFGHVFGNVKEDLVDQMYFSDLILPRYHNPMTQLCCGSAKTGAGVQSAMEWLIPLASRQQKERIEVKKKLEKKLEEISQPELL